MNSVVNILTKAAFLAPMFSVLVLAGCESFPQKANAAESPKERIVEQSPGKVVYWILPGPRKLSTQVFGTPSEPKMTLAPKLKAAKGAVAAGKMPPAVPDTLMKLPILVGVPMKARTMDANGRWWFKKPTPFGDDARIVQGSFTAHYWDAVSLDPPGPPGKTPDKAEMDAKFTDPAGNQYRVVVRHVVKPPFPGFETQGGVMIDSSHHGSTGTGSPLMPKVKTYAAFWGVGDIYINGRLSDSGRVMHMMTTEVVRDKNYRLASSEELPLAPDDRIVKGQDHHTHLVVFPLRAVKGKGPVFEPLKTAFMLPNGKPQPFMHIMYEQDTIDK